VVASIRWSASRHLAAAQEQGPAMNAADDDGQHQPPRHPAVTKALTDAINTLREAIEPLAKLHAIRNGAEALARLKRQDAEGARDALDHLSDMAIDVHGIATDDVQVAMQQGIELAERQRASGEHEHDGHGIDGNAATVVSGSKVAGGAPRFRLIPFEKLMPETDAEYLIQGLFPRCALIVTWGPPKCGKSFWTMDAALHVALGWEYRGRKVKQGPVVYCAFEGQSSYGKRAEAFRLRWLAKNADPVPFYLVAARMNFIGEHGELIGAIRLHLGANTKPAMVVLDTLNRSLVGSESDDKDMAAYVRAADAVRETFQCAVDIVHHCGVDGSRPRGHTSLSGAVDAQLAVKRDAADNVIVEVECMKDGPEGDKIACRLEAVEVATDPHGQPITSCVVMPVEDMATSKPVKIKGARMPKAAQTALRALREAIDEAGGPAPASNHIPAGVRVVSLERWREYAYRRGISASEEPRARQQAFKRGSEHLVGVQAVAIWDELAWLP